MKLEAVNTININGIKKIYSLIKRQIADSVQPKEKTKASFMRLPERHLKQNNIGKLREGLGKM